MAVKSFNGATAQLVTSNPSVVHGVHYAGTTGGAGTIALVNATTATATGVTLLTLNTIASQPGNFSIGGGGIVFPAGLSISPTNCSVTVVYATSI